MKPRGTAQIVMNVNNRRWKQSLSFRDAGPDEPVFVIDRQSGSIEFGDGVHGAIPSVGSTITVTYRYGDGSSGTIAKKIFTATDATKFWVIVRNNAQILGWGGTRNVRRVKPGKSSLRKRSISALS
jgi:hypothetical protein